MTEVLLVNALDLSDDRGLVEKGPEPSQMKDRLEVGPLDEGERLVGRPRLGGTPWVGTLAAEAIHLRPRKERQVRVLGRMLEQDVNPLLLDGIHHQKRVVGTNQDLQLA
jgi:hypothetical protein